MVALKLVQPASHIKHQITAEIVTVTPDIALAWLEKNVQNRDVSPRHINLFTRDMRQEEWVLTGQPIIFSWEGFLIDGQTRLMSCVKSSTPFSTLVVYGIDPKAQRVIDTGKTRTGRDLGKLLKLQNPAASIPIARMIHQIKNGGALFGGRSAISHADIERTVLQHPGLDNYVVNKGPKGMPWVALGFLNYVGSKLMDRKREAQAMVEVIRTGTPSRPGCPFHAFRERAMNSKTRADTRQALAWTLYYAWNLYIDGASVERIAMKTEKVEIDGLDLGLL